MRKLPFPWLDVSFSSAILIFVSVIMMLISGLNPVFFNQSRAKISDAFSPLLLVVGYPLQNATLLFHGVMGLAQLQADNVRLEQENERLREWYNSALLLDSENKALRQLLNLRASPEYEHVSARVLSDSGNTYLKSLLIYLGSDDGVLKGSPVVSGEGLIGRVIQVSEKSSRVLLLTDINSRIPVVVEDTGQHAIMAGTNSKISKLVHLPQESDISVGARLITSGYGGVYPHGLPVGKVTVTSGGSLGVLLFANFDRLQVVRILIKKNTL